MLNAEENSLNLCHDAQRLNEREMGNCPCEYCADNHAHGKASGGLCQFSDVYESAAPTKACQTRFCMSHESLDRPIGTAL